MKVYKEVEIYVDGCRNTCVVGFHLDADDCRLALEDNHQESEKAVLCAYSDFIRFFNSVPDEIHAGFNDHQRKIIGEHLETILAKVKGNSVV